MTELAEANGHCICGKVEVHVKKLNPHVGACHCRMCRNWGSGPYMEFNCGNDVAFTGEEHISVFSSSEWAERGFCSTCGTHLYYRLKESRDHLVSVGLFDKTEGFQFDNQVFVDEKPSFYSFSNETNEMTGAEVFAAFGTTKDQ